MATENFKRYALAGGITVILLTSLFAGFPGVQNSYADDFGLVIKDKASCEALPTGLGTQVWHDANLVCEITLNSSGHHPNLVVGGAGDFGFPKALTVAPNVTLLNNANIQVSYSQIFHVFGNIENKFTIDIKIGAVMIIHPEGSISENVRVLVREDGGLINRGTIQAAGSSETRGVSNQGHFFSDCNSTIINGPIFGNQPIDICGKGTGTIADATNQATGQSMYSGGRTFYGEIFTSGSSLLFKTVDCATVELRRHGSPTGQAQVGFFHFGASNVIFGTIDVSTLTTGYKKYEFCLPSSEDHVILADQILAVHYAGGDPINRIDVRRSNIGDGPDFDGTSTFHFNQDGPDYDGTSPFHFNEAKFLHYYNSDGKSRDLLFKLTNN